jgi:hypothetical protein
MIAHWKSGDTALPTRPFVSFFQLYATASTVNATVTPNHISISYPNTTQEGTDRFQYLIGDIPAPYYASGNVVSHSLVASLMKIDEWVREPPLLECHRDKPRIERHNRAKPVWRIHDPEQRQ